MLSRMVVGRNVTETGAHWATVRSIIDDSSNVSATRHIHFSELYGKGSWK